MSNLQVKKRGWKSYRLEQVCEILSGVRLTKAEQIDGDRPFIGATESNNGITDFIANSNRSLDNNVLGVNYNGSVVENFYHPYLAIFSDDVKRLKWRNKDGQNRYCYLFLKQMLLMQKEKYAYGYKFNGERMKKQNIMLPISHHQGIDYLFMGNYMKLQEFIKIYHILNKLAFKGD
ncbi:restriction endonuclease subunit S [Streptococcus cuniculi]|uniref:restriction endonuclease subunit S n=1 Tax=Streptococcus cuniculi TaxID=1432788 RepID=UPI001D16B9D4|nr:restriction endonuclease subunit S [Streptococcus cuniculi]